MRISDWSSDVCSSDLATNGDGAIFFAILLHFRASGFGIGFMSRFMLKLAPDLVEFGLHHARRHFEVVIGRELVKQLALYIGARKTIMLLLDLAFQQIAELLQARKPTQFREFIEIGRAHFL